MRPLLEKLLRADKTRRDNSSKHREVKMVTFKDEEKVQKSESSDILM